MKLSRGLLQAYGAQNFAYEALMALKQALTENGQLRVSREDAAAIKHLVSAWEAAQHRVSFHRRVPSPGVLKPAPGPKRKRRGAQVVAMPCNPPYEPEAPEANGNGTS